MRFCLALEFLFRCLCALLLWLRRQRLLVYLFILLLTYRLTWEVVNNFRSWWYKEQCRNIILDLNKIYSHLYDLQTIAKFVVGTWFNLVHYTYNHHHLHQLFVGPLHQMPGSKAKDIANISEMIVIGTVVLAIKESKVTSEAEGTK